MPHPKPAVLVLPGPTVPGLLLPELALLERLEVLVLEHPQGRGWAAGMPVEWGQPGAFPRLQQ